ncbi:MAG: ParB N-terminal domain-containing protein [Spirochaetes bacterium]|nr:ParB N-terminal domain-containing protein [Spirochaetota bacterium]
MCFFTGNTTVKNISIDRIDFSNVDYKLSRDFIDEKLVKSVNENGVMEPPVLFESEKSCIIAAGHNRLHVLKEIGKKNTNAYIIREIDHNSYIKYAVLKNYRGEIGPVGKMRFVRLLKDFFQVDQKNIILKLKQLQIPADIFYEKYPWDKAGILTESLRIYIDSKDVSFKNIKDILKLPEEAISLLSDWAGYGMRLNIFRGIVDMILEIIKRDKKISALNHIDAESFRDRRQKEELIFREVFNIRYPEYSVIKAKADSILKKLNAPGFNIHFPEYFESDEIGINLKINKREGVESFQKKLKKADMELIKDLFDLL